LALGQGTLENLGVTGMRVLVTGHRGYIGSPLVERLKTAGHEVVGVDTELYEDCTFGLNKDSGVRTINRDIRELSPADLEGIDAIAHLAGVCNDPLGDLLPETTYEINHAATVRLAKIAKASGVRRFVFSSSCSVYGAAGREWIDEKSEPNPITPYGLSKWNAEVDLRRLADATFSPVFLRSATAYGFSPRIRFDLVLNNLTAHAFTSGKVLLKSDGMSWRPIVHIEDIGRAFVAALEAPVETVHNEIFNVGITTENYRIREIAEIVRETVPGSRIEFAASAGPDKRTYRVDCSKVARLLPKFRPQWTARRGARDLYNRYTEYGLLLEDFEGARYQRLGYLQSLMARGAIDVGLRWIAPIAALQAPTARSFKAGC
jgi:nucleoside-diphosphate-sugar epimerase